MIPRTFVIVGDEDIRSQVRETLKAVEDLKLVGELCALQSRHLHFISELQPDFVVLDCASQSINPLLAAEAFRTLSSAPQVVAVVPEGRGPGFRTTSRLGFDAIVTTREALLEAFREPVESDDPRPLILAA